MVSIDRIQIFINELKGTAQDKIMEIQKAFPNPSAAGEAQALLINENISNLKSQTQIDTEILIEQDLATNQQTKQDLATNQQTKQDHTLRNILLIGGALLLLT